MEKITILYNDECPVCSLEIDHYRGLSSKLDLPLEFEKISDQGATLLASNLTSDDAKKRLHARAENGSLYIGVDAFLAIWDKLPYYRWLGRIIALPGIYSAEITQKV